MSFGRKGANWGAGILIIAFIAMMIIAIVAASFQGGGFGVGDPTYVANYYEKLFSAENLKNPFALVFTVFVPFISTFAITWAFIGVLPIFQGGYGHKTGERSAAVLAFGISLYTLPMMNMFLLSFFPWSIAIAVIMLFIGLIGRSLHWGIVPHLEAVEGIAGSARGIQQAWDSYKSPKNEKELKEKEEYKELKEKEEGRKQDIADRWNKLLVGYENVLKDIKDFGVNDGIKKYFQRSSDDSLKNGWKDLCNDLENLEKQKNTTLRLCSEMRKALQNPQEFENLFKKDYMASTMLNELQNSIEAIRAYHDATSRDFETVLKRLGPKKFGNDQAEIITFFEKRIEEYRDFIAFKNAPNNSIDELRTLTIQTLKIQ